MQAMPINPGDLAECRLGGATGEEQQAPPFVPGQDGVGTVLKARCQTHAKEESLRAGAWSKHMQKCARQGYPVMQKPQVYELRFTMFPCLPCQPALSAV